MKTIKITIRGISEYSQSKKYTDKVPASKADAYDSENWRKHMHVSPSGKVEIPSTGFKQAIEAAAKLTGDKVEGRGNVKWGSLMVSGIMVTDALETDVEADSVECQMFSCDAQGKRGDYSSSRVDRRFPMVPAGWKATGEVHIINDDVTPERVVQYIKMAGRCIGVGRFRPSKGGHNGRFALESYEVIDADV